MPPATLSFRPLRRPPMALLQVLDDSQQSGQYVRLRGDRIVLGREACDLSFPNDSQCSQRHAQILRRSSRHARRWYLRDLGSRNGTFVRIERARLKGAREFIVGRRRFLFREVPEARSGDSGREEAGFGQDGADFGQDGDGGDRGATRETQFWQDAQQASDVGPGTRPELIELSADGSRRIMRLERDQSLGSDSRDCTIVVADDRSVSPLHAHLRRTTDGSWHLEDAGSLNGLWIRIESVHLSRETMFWIGEQRFVFRPL